MHDRIGDGYALLRLVRDKINASTLEKSFAIVGAPFSILDIDNDAVRKAYSCNYLIVRPDLHVVWRGDTLPADPRNVARAVTGH